MKKLSRLSFMLLLALMMVSSAQAQKKVKTFTVSHVIDAPAEKVWEVVGVDYGAIAHSHPKIVSSDYVEGTLKAGEGAERICHFNAKGTRFLKEKQLNYDPQNYTFKNQVFQAGKFPVSPEHTFAIYKVEPIDAQTSRFTFDMTYRTKPAFMGGLMKGNFKKLIRDYAIAIEHYVKTGESVNKDNFKSIKKKYDKSRKS
ncbi:MAG: SRPBCC family protein [Bacteroidota bacterium]